MGILKTDELHLVHFYPCLCILPHFTNPHKQPRFKFTMQIEQGQKLFIRTQVRVVIKSEDLKVTK